MEFLGNKRMYKKMIIGGSIVAFLAILMATITQRDGVQFINAFLYALGGGAAGGFVGVPLVYLSQPVKKVVITDDELQVIEGKKPKVVRIDDIETIKLMRNGIRIRHKNGRLIISGMHGYAVKDIYDYLNSKRSA